MAHLFTPISLFHAYRKQSQKPILFESRGIHTSFCKRSVLGTHYSKRLDVFGESLYCEGERLGHASSLLSHLRLPLGDRFFPAWMGFFSYEYARHLKLPTKKPLSNLPDASFFLYDEGFRWENRVLCERPNHALDPIEFRATDIPQVALQCDFERDDFLAAVQTVQERIRSGDVYQVNLSQRFHFDSTHLDPLSLYVQLAESNPSPFMGLIVDDDWSIVSGSPERLFNYTHGIVTTRPIAGTRRRGKTPNEDAELENEMLSSRKERAEHTMLVDLLRNDLARVCEPGTVRMSEAFTVERYSHVMHLVSEVAGIANTSFDDIFRSIFPGGTITGTPKESAMQCIADLEPVPRGPYTGSIGYVSSGYGADFNILIRSFVLAKNKGYLSAGAGIVIESDPQNEYEEIQHKAQSLRHVLKCGRAGAEPRAPRFFSSWQPPLVKRRFNAHVAFIENHDSFSYNIIDYLQSLGCKVTVFDHKDFPNVDNFSHVILGPGPGEPSTSGALMQWLQAALSTRIPLLGICLGHQALGTFFGARLTRARRPVHGEPESITHIGRGLFTGITNPFTATRYHSLCLDEIPEDLVVHAFSDDDHVMAIAHKSLPAFGVQFHPESFLSSEGLSLLENFLAITHANPNTR